MLDQVVNFFLVHAAIVLPAAVVLALIVSSKARAGIMALVYQAYQRLQGLRGIPRCHGVVAGHYLVLDFVRGTPYREASWSNRDGWFSELLAVLDQGLEQW